MSKLKKKQSNKSKKMSYIAGGMFPAGQNDRDTLGTYISQLELVVVFAALWTVRLCSGI